MARGELRCPNFVIGAAGVGVLPGVSDVERTADHACPHLIAKEPFEHVFVDRESVLRKNGIAEFLKLIQDFMVKSRIVVVGTSQHDDADAVILFQLIKHLSGALANASFVFFQSRKSGFHRAVVFLKRQTEHWLPHLQHLMSE